MTTFLTKSQLFRHSDVPSGSTGHADTALPFVKFENTSKNSVVPVGTVPSFRTS
jgi:hypothetical protein